MCKTYTFVFPVLLFTFQKTKYLYFPSGKVVLYWCERALDKDNPDCMWVLCGDCQSVRLKRLEEKESMESSAVGSSRARPTRGSGRGSGNNIDSSDCCPNHAMDIRTLGAPSSGCAWLTLKNIEAKKREYERNNDMEHGTAVNGKHIHIPDCCYDCKGLIPAAFGLNVKDSNVLCQIELAKIE